MTAEKRNARVVIALIGALTIGASVLLWMEPRPGSATGANRNALLAAQRTAAAESLTITYAQSLASVDRSRFDGVIRPDGVLEWESLGSQVRVLIVGGGGEELSQVQKQRLLDVVGWLTEQRGLDLHRVALERGSDARLSRGLPGEARELATFLIHRGVLQ